MIYSEKAVSNTVGGKSSRNLPTSYRMLLTQLVGRSEARTGFDPPEIPSTTLVLVAKRLSSSVLGCGRYLRFLVGSPILFDLKKSPIFPAEYGVSQALGHWGAQWSIRWVGLGFSTTKTPSGGGSNNDCLHQPQRQARISSGRTEPGAASNQTCQTRATIYII